MAEVTYYFNARGDAVWTDPDNIVDNNLETFGSTATNGASQLLNGNTCPATDLGTITKVELRLYGKGDGDDHIDITPIFSAGDGDPHRTTPVVSPGDWTAYVDITNDTNHPDWSLWSHIQTLDCKIAFAKQAKANTVYCAKVEVRVTYWVPPVSDIDVGAIPIDRTAREISGSTQIDKNNPANASGMLHTILVYAYEDITGLKVGTFYTTNGNTLKCRDSVLIGDVSAGLQTFNGLSITVEAGDYIGFYCSTGSIDSDTTGFAGRWRVAGAYIDPGDETTYSFFDGYAISLYGYGDFVAPIVTTQAVSNILHTKATGNGNITNTGGENPSKRGVCWNTTGNPTVADSKSEETDSFGTGAFTRPMTGLTRGQHYYVRAYAYNSLGYGYGSQVEFDTLSEDIDVGADPIDRATIRGAGLTYIDKSNPANASGILHTIQIWAFGNITGLIVGTFYITNGNTLKCRDSEAIGDVEAGARRTFTELSIAVQEGDYIGCYFTAGTIETDLSGFVGVWYLSGEYIDPGDEATYSFLDGDAISLYGYGDIVAAPENTVYLVKATGQRTQLAAGAVAIRIDPTTGRRSLDTSLTKFLVREDDGTLRAKSA